MGENANNGLAFDLTLTGAFAAIGALTGALQLAIELAVFPGRVEVEDESPRARLEAVTNKVLRESKSMLTEGMPETDDAAGTRVAIAVVEDVTARLRREI